MKDSSAKNNVHHFFTVFGEKKLPIPVLCHERKRRAAVDIEVGQLEQGLLEHILQGDTTIRQMGGRSNG